MTEEKLFYRFDEILVRPDGSRRAPEEAAKIVGWRAVWLAQLREALEEAQNRPVPLSVPPRIFVSYRWGTEAEDEWVADLVSRLRALGNAVVYDRALQRGAEPPTVPELVAQIATAHIFLAVIDPGYVERTGSWTSRSIKDGWVFDEWQTALGLQQAGQVKLLGLVREGSDLPSGFTAAPREGVSDSWRRHPGNTYDVRDSASLQRVLDRAFTYSGPSLSQQEWERANALYSQSQEAFAEERTDDAECLARQLTEEFPNVPDGFAQWAQVAASREDHSTALAAAQRALQIDPDFTGVFVCAALSAYVQKQYEDAIRYGSAALWVGSDVAKAHYAVGNALDELLQVYPALAHLELARADLPVALVHNDTGMVYRRARLPESALRCFEEGLRHEGADDNLRINAIAAAIEAGDAARAQAHLRGLGRSHPMHAKLSHVLAEWQQREGPPPGLMPRLKPRTAVGIVTCTDCKAHIPLLTEDERLCVRCGAERLTDQGPCPFCEHVGVVMPGGGGGGLSWECPYCRRGFLRFEPTS